MELSQEQKLAFNKAAVLCSQSEKCASEIQEKLKRWGLNEDDSLAVIDKLITEKYIDDERFARAYVKDKFRFNHWGRQKIEFMLQSKKINQEILDLAFEEIEDESYFDEIKRLLTDKGRSIKATDAYDKRNKLMRFALGRGFESGKIYAALKELGL